MNTQKAIEKQSKAYEVAFLVENLIRVAMHNAMVTTCGTDYFNSQTFPPYECNFVSGQKRLDIVAVATERKTHERAHNIALGYDYPYLWYLDFTILLSLLDKYRNTYFHSVFKGPKKAVDDVLLRLRGMIPIRNALAHNRYISDIDLADLQGLSQVLRTSLNDVLLVNFDDIALNTTEQLFHSLIALLKQTRSTIGNGGIIDRTRIRKLRSTISAIAPIAPSPSTGNQFAAIENLIAEYNRIPRRPGAAQSVRSFVKSTFLEEKILHLISTLGG